MTLLPARAPPVEGESLCSIVRRMAAAMGYDTVQQILSQVSAAGHVPSWLNEVSDRNVVTRLAELFSMPPQRIADCTINKYAAALVLKAADGVNPVTCDLKTRLRYFTPQSRVCPLCSSSDTAAEMLIWAFRPVPICLQHQVMLVSRCHGCGERISNNRLSTANCRCGENLSTTQATNLSHAAVESISNVDQSLRSQTPLIKGASVSSGFYWLHRTSDAVSRCAKWSAGISETLELTAALSAEDRSWIIAAYTLGDWPHRYVEFLDSYVRHSKYTFTSTGVSRRFGSLLREAGRLEQIGSCAIADVLRAYLTGQYTAGHVTRKICLFKSEDQQESLNQGRWISQTAAARQLRTSLPAIRRLVAQNTLRGEVNSAGAHGRSVGVVSQESLDALKQQLTESVTCKEAAQQLEIDRHRILNLIHEGVLQQCVLIGNAWRIPQTAIGVLLDVVNGLPVTKQATAGWISIREATQKHGRSGLNVTAIVKLLASNSVRGRRLNSPAKFNGVLLNHEDLLLRLPEIRDDREKEIGFPLCRIAQFLFPGRPTKERVLKKLIDLKLLIAVRESREWRVADSEIKRFQATYCVAADAAKIVNRARITLARWETEGRITPVYGKRVSPGAGFSIYRRADLERFIDEEDSASAAPISQERNTTI